jgi:hypothetical protein
VKPDANKNINSNGQYVNLLAKKTLATLNNSPCAKTPSTIAILKKCDRKCYKQPHYTKPEESYAPISNTDYIRKFDNICTSNDTPFIQNTINHGVLPGPSKSY